MRSFKVKPKLVVLGALPPPHMGPTLATHVVLNSPILAEKYEIIHVDLSDTRNLKTLGKFDFLNVFISVSAYIRLMLTILVRWPDVVYIQISQTTIGYLRDSIFILICALFRRKCVCHLRGGNFGAWFQACGLFMRWYVKRVHKLVANQIVLGENLRPLFDGIVNPNRISVVPNGKDVFFPKPETQNGPFRILFAANMNKSKGVIDVLAAIPDVVAPDASGMILA